MDTVTFSIFYGNGSPFQCKTDVSSIEIAHDFTESWLFKEGGYTLDFILKDGVTLVKGTPSETSEKFFKDSMEFAIDIPFSEYLRNDQD